MAGSPTIEDALSGLSISFIVVRRSTLDCYPFGDG
jgi:hypothetical protein